MPSLATLDSRRSGKRLIRLLALLLALAISTGVVNAQSILSNWGSFGNLERNLSLAAGKNSSGSRLEFPFRSRER
jgi:hypothetical protein